MTVNDVIARLPHRKKRPGTFGYGVTTADVYVRDALTGPNRAKCPSRLLNGVDASQLVKDAENKLVNCDPNATVTDIKSPTDSSLPDHIKAPKNTLMVFRNIITTPREDRDGDLLLTRGAMPDPKMPLLWQHLPVMPLGKMLAVDRHDDDMLRVWTALLDLNESTEDAAKLIEADALRISHGFAPLEFEERLDKSGDFSGFLFHKYEIMEESLVSVPSNVDAVISTYSRNGLKSALFKRWGQRLFEDRPTQVAINTRQRRGTTGSPVQFSLPSNMPYADGPLSRTKTVTVREAATIDAALKTVLSCLTDPTNASHQLVSDRLTNALAAMDRIKESRRVGEAYRDLLHQS